jgi:hypothetical protein
MPIAARSFPADINPPLTAASLRDGLRDALVVAGFPAALKSYVVGTDQYAVWELVFNTKTYGKAYYRIKVTSGLVVTHAVGATWTDSTNTLGNPSAESQSTAYLANVAVKSWGFRSDELCLLSTVQGSATQLLGYFRFLDAPAFDEASFPKIFIARTNDVDSLTSTALAPYSTFTYSTSLNNAVMATADLFLQQRSQVTGFFLYGPTNSGVIARSSDELSMGACASMVRGDIFQVPDTNPLEQYLLLKPGAGALLVRIQ